MRRKLEECKIAVYIMLPVAYKMTQSLKFDRKIIISVHDLNIAYNGLKY